MCIIFSEQEGGDNDDDCGDSDRENQEKLIDDEGDDGEYLPEQMQDGKNNTLNFMHTP